MSDKPLSLLGDVLLRSIRSMEDRETPSREQIYKSLQIQTLQGPDLEKWYSSDLLVKLLLIEKTTIKLILFALLAWTE